MSEHPSRHNQPINDKLHPLIYKSLVGLTIWLVVSMWFLFDRGNYIELILAMITVFFVVATGIPLLIWLIWRARAVSEDHVPEESFRAWASQQYSTLTGNLPGGAAAAQILLPIMAVAFGMTIFGLVFDLTIPHLS